MKYKLSELVEQGGYRTVVLPKEGNVADFVRENFDIDAGGLSVRITKAWSEDVPLVVEKLENAVGLTGEDYFEEYRLRNARAGLDVARLYPWYNPEFLFRYPALCLLGPKGQSIATMPKKLSVCVNMKWSALATDYINKELRQKRGYEIGPFLAVRGETEERFRDGGIDAVAEVVCKGNGAIAAGLKPYEIIFLNRGVVAIAKTI